jgi:hypothetical protein
MLDVMISLKIYFTFNQGGTYSLGDFPNVAQKRWEWIVDNWKKYKDIFKTSAAGDQRLLLSYENLKSEINSYKLGSNKNPLDSSSKYETFKPFLDIISLTEIGLNNDEIANINEEITKIANFQESDFRNMIDFLNNFYLDYENSVGLSDATVLALYGMVPKTYTRAATIQDLSILSDLKEMIRISEGLIFNLQITQKKPPNLLNIANNNIDQELSNYRVLDIFQTSYPVPFEISLEHMAIKYLGSSRLWFELVTVNNLQPPFIDEVGTKFSLLAPAAANNLIISSELSTYVSPGTYIGIGSHRFKEESRVVEKVLVNTTDETMTLFLGGDQNLNRYTTNDKSYVRIYKPHTTRKGKFILIPTTLPSTGLSAKKTPSKDELRRLQKPFIEFGFDVAKDLNTGDWIIDPNGNFKIAAGVKAIKQAVLNAVKTQLNELPFHPEYGVNYQLGEMYFGSVDEAVVFGNMVSDAILKDSRFENALISKADNNEGGVSVQIIVKIKGLGSPIPLSFIS